MTLRTASLRSACPGCQAPNDAVTEATEGGSPLPREGDLMICFYCGCLGVYVDDLGCARLASEDEEREFMGDPRVAKIRSMVLMRIAGRSS